MTVEQWAQKVATAVLVLPGERAPVDMVLVDHLDEFEELARVTRLKIPAFARALTAAGLSLTSGLPYDAATLRTQINRARAKRSLRRSKDDTRFPALETIVKSPPTSTTTRPIRPPARSTRGSPAQLPAKGENESILARLERSKPRRVRSLDHDEE
jgi:hypothetical protein